MSSFIGATNNGYESISDYRLYLDLNLNDKEFATNLYTPTYFTELNNNISCYPQTYDTLGNFSNPINTIYNELKTQNNEFVNLIDSIFPTLCSKHLNTETCNQITAFIPLNINNLQNTFKNGNYRIENILKYHLVDYPILPVQLFNSINKIYTKYDNQYITVGGTQNELYILNRDIINSSNYKNKILKTLKVDNGIIYFIDKPLIPYLY
jgi:uncharacterized surface protein with fasciclin (FAS1) repeats